MTIQGKGPRTEGIRDAENGLVIVEGFVHRVRDMGGFAFVAVRTGRTVTQCVYNLEQENAAACLPEAGETVRIFGTKVPEPRAEGGFEVRIDSLESLSKPAIQPPVPLMKRSLDVHLEVNLDNRPISLRHPKERAIFRIQAVLAQAFARFLAGNGFTEIHTPKTVSAGAEGGANIFKLDYFGQPACLAQSPQLYKQTMVGVFGRVFEVAPVFRAEKHSTTRHLNEYISMDFEMGFIDSFYDIMDTETAYLRYAFEVLKTECATELEMLKVELPTVGEIPVMKFRDAKKLMVDYFGRKLSGHGDLDPEEEVLLCEYAKKEFGSEFIFITHYPAARRPFYVMEDPNESGYAFSFDLLFRGLEITTGGQRIHDYQMQIDKMKDFDLNPDEFKDYLVIHACGMPPHGGLGLGLERLVMQLLNLKNVRYASLFPRDMKRMLP